MVSGVVLFVVVVAGASAAVFLLALMLVLWPLS